MAPDPAPGIVTCGGHVGLMFPVFPVFAPTVAGLRIGCTALFEGPEREMHQVQIWHREPRLHQASEIGCVACPFRIHGM